MLENAFYVGHRETAESDSIHCVSNQIQREGVGDKYLVTRPRVNFRVHQWA